ncbi:MAG: MFS transporter, partial [Patescibacteria group bacterium]
FTGIAWPAIKGAQADLVSEHKNFEQEIELVQDTFTNLGFIIGPILAGFLSSRFGFLETLGIIGVIIFIVSLLLLIFTPNQLFLKKKS